MSKILKNVSPLRYPGGKAKLYPFFKQLVANNNIGTFVEPFAGGSGCALGLLLNGDVDSIVLNEYDPAVYAFWWAVLNKPDEFAQLVSNAVFSVDEWKKQKEIYTQQDTSDLLQLGFSTLYLNRVNRSGILSAGLIGGLQQTGNYKMDARFNKQAIIKKIQAIAACSEKIVLTSKDASQFLVDYMKEHEADISSTLFFIDPPYYEKGGQLYPLSFKHNDHVILSNVMKEVEEKNGRYIITYDNHPVINDLYSDFESLLFYLNYSVAGSRKQSEAMFYSDKLVMQQAKELLHVAPGKERVARGEVHDIQDK